MNMLSQIIIELTDETDVPDDVAVEMRALRLLDAEVRDAANELTDAQANLAEMTTAYKTAQRKLTDIVTQIQTHEGYVLQALNQENQALALEVAEKIASLEKSQAEIAASANNHAMQCEKLTDMLHQNEHNLYVLKQQIDTIKATQSVHRAQMAVCDRYGDTHHAKKSTDDQPKLRTALDALGAMNAKRSLKSQPFDEVAQASQENSIQRNDEKTDELLQKLQAAGIATSNKKAEDVLARIKNKP